MKRKLPTIPCPYCLKRGHSEPCWIQHGSYRRRDDKKRIFRYRCNRCGRSRSDATGSYDFGEKRRSLNALIFAELSSTKSLNRLALTLKCNRKTVVRKFVKLSQRAATQNMQSLNQQAERSHPCEAIYFDEMIGFIHSTWKPVSIALVVSRDRMIRSLNVASIPASGPSAEKARKLYGERADLRRPSLVEALKQCIPIIDKDTTFVFDKASDYPSLLQNALPFSPKIETYKGRKAAKIGFGELKGGGWDPLFPLNHTAAMIRANVNRLLRKTWCTSKRQDRLKLHLELYAFFHNQVLIPIQKKEQKKRTALDLAFLQLIGRNQ